MAMGSLSDSKEYPTSLEKESIQQLPGHMVNSVEFSLSHGHLNTGIKYLFVGRVDFNKSQSLQYLVHNIWFLFLLLLLLSRNVIDVLILSSCH